MPLRRLRIPRWTTVIGLALCGSSVSAVAQVKSSPPKVMEKDLAFPSPVQWKLNSDNRNVGVSLTGIAWGPAAALEVIAKGNERHINEKSEPFSERSYVIALGFQARMATPLLDMRTRSGLIRIKDVDGNMQPPWDLTSSGFVEKDYDIHFAREDVTTEYWDFFPVPPKQHEFLFEVHSPAESVLYFRVIRTEGDLRVINSTPDTQSASLQFDKSFGGSIGVDSVVIFQIARQNTALSGTEQYARVGKTLWLVGVVDSLGNFVIEERYPKDRVTGILKGRFDANYQTMSGYFSKPDGSQLQPFEFHEVQPVGTQPQSPSQQDCGANGLTAEPPRPQ
jgi:hypothetical protein